MAGIENGGKPNKTYRDAEYTPQMSLARYTPWISLAV